MVSSTSFLLDEVNTRRIRDLSGCPKDSGRYKDAHHCWVVFRKSWF